MSKLLVYDTSNFIDYPIGGQLTSIGNFLRFLCERYPHRVESILLVGVTKEENLVGKRQTIILYGKRFSFLPVAAVGESLSDTSKSLRLTYVKGLLKYKKALGIKKKDCNYIHTPEAYGVVKLFAPFSQCVIFSHGSYFNMERGFRFFQKNFLIKKGFVLYLKWILRNANMIFALDKDCQREYAAYNDHLVKVVNSVVCNKTMSKRRAEKRDMVKEILFVGRLSKDKRVGPIIQAVQSMENRRLTIVGDGEEYSHLIHHQSETIIFVGAVAPNQVAQYMERADVLVMNSAFEGIPMTVLEALSQGLPVVSTNVGGVGEALVFGQDSEETDGTSESIVRAIQRVEASYRVYAENAFQNAKAFDYQNVNEKVYEALCQYWKEG